MVSTPAHCANCGTAIDAEQRFCPECGTPVAGAGPTQPAAQITPSSPPDTVSFWQREDFWPDMQERAKRGVFGLVGSALAAFMDLQLHDEAAVALLIFAAGAAITLFFREILAWAMQRLNLGGLSRFVQPLLFTVPAALLFVLRGKGDVIPGREFQGKVYSDKGISSGDAMLIGAVIAILPLAVNYLLPRFDQSLRGFYELRNRYIPSPFRPFAMIAVTLVVTFGLIHGSLFDFKVMLGQTADKAALPEFNKVLLTAISSVVLGVVLMRDPRDADGEQVGQTQ